MAKKQTTRKKGVDRKAVPYSQIEVMAKAGKSALEIAQKLGRTTKGADPSHSIRAILSRMRTVGWRDDQGKLRKLTVKRVGGQEKQKGVEKAGKKPTKKSALKAKAAAPTQPDGKSLAAGDGQ